VQEFHEEAIRELKTIEPESKYYAITLLGTEKGNMEWSAYTHWEGWASDKPGREIRKASTVNAMRMAETWDAFGETYVVVNNEGALLIFLRLGGHALVKKEIADDHLLDFVSAQETAFDGMMGFKSIENLPKQAFKRAPTPKHRMKIIKRDHYRCQICGRRPDDYTDIELHVHHIRLWSGGGLTEDDNLITLCDTCHSGLDPHEEHSLFFLLDSERPNLDINKNRQEYYEGVHRYREIAQQMFEDIENNEA